MFVTMPVGTRARPVLAVVSDEDQLKHVIVNVCGITDEANYDTSDVKRALDIAGM